MFENDETCQQILLLWFLFLLRCYKIRHCSLQEIQNKYSLITEYYCVGTIGQTWVLGGWLNTQRASSICQWTRRGIQRPISASHFPRADDQGLALTFVFFMRLLRVIVVPCWFFIVSCKSFFCRVGTLWLWHAGSGVVACRLSRSAAGKSLGFLGGSAGKESACNARDPGSIPGSGRIPWRRKWQPTPVSLPGESHEQRSLGSYSP